LSMCTRAGSDSVRSCSRSQRAATCVGLRVWACRSRRGPSATQSLATGSAASHAKFSGSRSVNYRRLTSWSVHAARPAKRVVRNCARIYRDC
jgi:hypothetical protein